MRNKPVLTSDDVFKMVAACKAARAKIKREPTIAVVDGSGHLIYLERRVVRRWRTQGRNGTSGINRNPRWR